MNDSVKFGGENERLGRFAYAHRIEDVEGTLRVVLTGTYEGEKGTGISEGLRDDVKEALKESCPLLTNEDEAYEIIFPEYIMYQVRTEEYCSWDEYEIRKGHILCIFERSRLLDYREIAVDCCGELASGGYHPGKWTHYGIYSDFQIIDVITHKEPIIKKIVMEAE